MTHEREPDHTRRSDFGTVIKRKKHKHHKSDDKEMKGSDHQKKERHKHTFREPVVKVVQPEVQRKNESHSQGRHDDYQHVKIKQEPKDDWRNRPIKSEPRESQEHQSGRQRGRHEERHRGRPDDRREHLGNTHRRERAFHDERRRKHREKHRDEDRIFQYGKPGSSSHGGQPADQKPKDAPDFKLSGKLAEDTNTYKGVVIKYNEPDEARKPKTRWRLYPFKGDEALPVLQLHRQSAYLLGRDRIVADIPIDHPSCSKQHAILQYRLVNYERDDGLQGRRVRPYIIDLDSANGTFVNNKRIDPRRFVELMEKDVVKFGYSSREYVLLHENSKDVDPENDEGEML